MVSGSSLDPAGPAAREIADLWWILLAVGVVGFAAFAAVLVYALLRRPATTRDDPSSDAGGPTTQRLLVGGGVLLPLAAILISFGFTIVAMRALAHDAPPSALKVDVVGHRWWWDVRYPGHDIRLRNEIRIPVGEPVELRLTSRDVIHSLWVPSLAGKLDLLPDGVNTLVIEADRPGRYRGQCAEFCGLRHAEMRIVVVAQPRAQFDRWLAGGAGA